MQSQRRATEHRADHSNSAFFSKLLGNTIPHHVVYQLSRLQELAARLSDRGDSVAAGHALEAWGVGLSAYLAARRDCSIVVRSEAHPLAPESDSHWLINRALEQLNDLGTRFVRNSQVPNARAITRVYQRLGETAARIEFVNHRGENPILDQLTWYLGLYANSSHAKTELDIPFAAAEAMIELAEKGIETGLAYVPVNACRQLDSIVAANARVEHLIVVEACMKGSVRLLWRMLKTPNGPRHFGAIVDSIERTQNTLQALMALMPGRAPATPLWSANRLALEELRNVLRAYARDVWNVPEGRQRNAARASFEDCADRLYDFVRRMAETATASSAYADLLAPLTFDVVRAYGPAIGDRYSTGDDVKRWVYLPTWIMSNVKPMNDPRVVLESARVVSRMALYLMELNAPVELVLAAIESQRAIVDRIIDRHSPSYGYDEPRAVVPFIFVLALAQKNKDDVVAEATLAAIRAAEDGYKKKWGAAKPPTSVLAQVLDARNDFLSRELAVGFTQPHIQDARRLVTVEDLDRAIFSAWRVIPKNSPARKELLQRGQLLLRLLRVLAGWLRAREALE